MTQLHKTIAIVIATIVIAFTFSSTVEAGQKRRGGHKHHSTHNYRHNSHHNHNTRHIFKHQTHKQHNYKFGYKHQGYKRTTKTFAPYQYKSQPVQYNYWKNVK